MVLLFGDEVKGARRWISIFGFSVQPSEFIKPAFAVVAAWLIAALRRAGQVAAAGWPGAYPEVAAA